MKFPTSFWRWSIGLAAATPLACSPHIHKPVAAYQQLHPAPPGAWSAGVAREEITPKAGYPMGGHGLGGRVSRGRWLPLYARAFFLRDAAGNSVALVSCDLPAISARLQQEVAFRVNQAHSEISRENLVLAATHTHHGPGNYMSSTFYNNFLSQIPGYDDDEFNGLATKIADCVNKAIAAASSSVEVRFGVGDIRTMTGVRPFVRNRAVASFLRNQASAAHSTWPSACDFLYGGPPSDPCKCDADASRNCDVDTVRHRAFDGRLSVLSIFQTAPTPKELGRLVFFGTHPTGMSDHSTFNSSDYTGLAMRTLEKTSGDPDFVAGFFNGTEGDVSPTWLRQDAEDVRALSAEFLKAIGNVTASTVLPGSASISVRRGAWKQRDFCHRAVPVMGVATLGGAEDGRAVTFDLGWRSPARGVEYKRNPWWNRLGLWRLNNPNQGEKQPALDYSSADLWSLTELATPPKGYPGEVPLTVVRLGDIELLAVPFEVTTLAGEQIRNTLSPLPGPTLIVGLANEYLSYVTTEREYELQDYEGASTLYGTAAAACLADKLKETAAPSPTPIVYPLAIPAVDFDVGPAPTFNMPLGPKGWGANPIYSDKSVESPFEEAAFSSSWPRFEWEALQTLPDAHLEIFRNAGAAWVKVTDDDDSFLLLELVNGKALPAPAAAKNLWNAVWLHRDSLDTQQYVFVARSGSAVCSAPFNLQAIANETMPLPLSAALSCPPGLP